MLVVERDVPVGPEATYFAMVLIIKDQPDDIRAWIEHHRRLGVSKFYVYDHNSKVPLLEPIADLVLSGVITYHRFARFIAAPSLFPQTYVYDSSLRQYAARHRFIGYWDVDEFLVPTGEVLFMPDLLRYYEPYGALAINVRLFGSSGHVKRPQGSVFEAYTKCFPLEHPDNRHVKVIVNTRYAKRLGGTPHNFVYNETKWAVSENYLSVPGPWSIETSVSRVIINHYSIKSHEEFQAHMERGSAHGNIKKSMEFFHWVENTATDTCTYAVKFGRSDLPITRDPRLRQLDSS